MISAAQNFYTAFRGHNHLASGPLPAVAIAVKRALEERSSDSILIFDNHAGRSIDIDTRGSDEEVVARLTRTSDSAAASPNDDAARGRGRPRLGVVPREVTLLPRHWEWLASQPGGASVALRKLVEEARRTHAGPDQRRKAQERAYHFMSAMAGDMPGFEEAARALFANDMQRLREMTAAWPDDVREHSLALAESGDERQMIHDPMLGAAE